MKVLLEELYVDDGLEELLGKQLVRHITRFDRETNETLYAYAHFLGEPTEHVLNQLVDTMLAKDKEFVAWRAEHPESYVTRRRTAVGTGPGPRGTGRWHPHTRCVIRGTEPAQRT